MNQEKTGEKTKNPFQAIFDFKKEEIPIAFLMFSFFFLIITVFQILRPLAAGYVVDIYGAEPELYMRLGNIVVAALAVVVFTFLYNKLPRQRLIFVFCLFFAASFIVLRFLLVEPKAVAAWWYYIQVNLITTIWMATFWAYLTDISTSDQAKRLYGFIGFGGVSGGVLGPLLAKVLLPKIGQGGLLFVSAVLMLAVAFITFGVETLLRRSKAFGHAVEESLVQKEPEKKVSKLNVAIEGAKLAFRSKYLAAIVGIMAFYETASQFLNFMYKKSAEVIPGTTATQSLFIDVQLIAGVVSMVVQLFLVSLIMRKLGLAFALCVLPVIAILSTGFFMAAPSLAAASLLFISDNGFNYSIQQTSREALYVPTSPDEKYKARAFTNMFVQRAGKGIAIVGTLVLINIVGISVRALGFFGIAALVGMALLGIFGGRRFKEMSRTV
ncbi:MAG: Npt1/Npt2 family nucleotide transporter [Candidatus Aminicenantes bacterium]|jgi:AAA family ATP:ADP antiporter